MIIEDFCDYDLFTKAQTGLNDLVFLSFDQRTWTKKRTVNISKLCNVQPFIVVRNEVCFDLTGKVLIGQSLIFTDEYQQIKKWIKLNNFGLNQIAKNHFLCNMQNKVKVFIKNI